MEESLRIIASVLGGMFVLVIGIGLALAHIGYNLELIRKKHCKDDDK